MNKTNSLVLSVVAALSCASISSHAAPLVSVGDNVDIFFNGSSSARWMSNVFRDENDEADDLILTLSPGFEMNVGRGVSNADLSVITRYDILRYNDQSQLDTELLHIKAIGSYKSSRLDLNADASFDEKQTSSGEANLPQGADDLIESELTRATLNGEYRLSPKFSFGAGAQYSETDYTNYEELYADRESYTFPFDLFYELTPKVDLSGGYSYGNTDVDDKDDSPGSGYQTETHFFNVGARGNLLPKLSGSFKVGYRVRNPDDSVGVTRDSSSMLGLDSGFTWTVTPKLATKFGLSRDFGVSGEGTTTETSSLDMSANYSISSNFSTSADLGYTLRDYQDESNRKDNQYRAGLHLAYVPNQSWRFGTGYTYVENDSDAAEQSYQNHIVDLTATLRY